MKELKWKDEQEWRKVLELKSNESIHYYNGKPYMEYYLDKSTLTGITVFCTTYTLDKAKTDATSLTNYITERGYNAEVRVEVFE